MNPILLTPFILAAGVLQAAGNVMNNQLRASLANPWLASSVSFLLVLFVTLALFAVMPRPLPSGTGIGSMPWWAPLGGVAGAVAVVAGLIFVGRIGAGPFNGLIITGNILASLAIDHYAVMGMPQHTLSPGRALGAALMVAGIALIARF